MIDSISRECYRVSKILYTSMNHRWELTDSDNEGVFAWRWAGMEHTTDEDIMMLASQVLRELP